MIPIECMPGFTSWGASLERLLGRPEAIWVCGAAGTGVSTLGQCLADRRKALFLDDADGMEPEVVQAWLQDHPRGVLGAHRLPEDCAMPAEVMRCLSLRLASLEEDPVSVGACLAALAAQEGLADPLPSALGKLPCPGNLLGLRNRLLRWNLLRQLPEASLSEGEGGLPLEDEDLATNLHVLERLLLHRALRRSYGNRVEAARRLGVSRRQLYLLIARHGDPVRGDAAVDAGPARLRKQRMRKNSSADPLNR